MILANLSDPRIERMLANNTLLRSVIEQTWEHVMAFDRKTELVYSSSSRNPKLSQLAEAPGPFLSLIEPEYRTEFLTQLTHVRGANEASSFEYVILAGPAGPVWLHSRFCFLGDAENDEDSFVFVFSHDVTKRKQEEAALKTLAYQDPLTNLPNRRALLEHYHRTLAFSKRYNLRFGLVYIDVDDFKNINDRFGHGGGDECLKHIAATVAACLRESDILARVGGDEFVILLNRIPHISVIEMFIQRMYSVVGKGFEFEGESIGISLSIGVALYPEHGDSLQRLLSNADSALYQAKRHSKNTYRIFAE